VVTCEKNYIALWLYVYYLVAHYIDRKINIHVYGVAHCFHGVTYYYFTYYCFIEYVCDYVMSTHIDGHCPYCLLKRDGATRWTRCDKL